MKSHFKADVEIQITPMLDMAFQLLTFFIMTYNPAPTEGQFAMNLLPAQPATAMGAEVSSAEAAPSDLPAALRTLPTALYADDAGRIGRVTIGEAEVQGMDQLSAELDQILNDPTLPFDQALIKVDPRLRYEELMQVINVFAAHKVTKVSFAELDPNEPAGL